MTSSTFYLVNKQYEKMIVYFKQQPILNIG